jgi:hypothetical protein
MIIRIVLFSVLIAVAGTLTGCLQEDDFEAPYDNISDFTFDQNLQGWQGGFANYSLANPDSFSLSVSHADFPTGDSPSRKALKLSARNYNEALLMFGKVNINGLKPETSYEVALEISFAGQIEASYGLSESQGDLYLKMATSRQEPLVTPDAESAYPGQYELNLDFGDFNSDGEDAKILGSKPLNSSERAMFYSTGSFYQRKVIAVTDQNGKVWLLVGFSTNLPVKYSILIDRVIFYFREV